ncbi:MAG: hypothetical protein ABL995_12440 [Bryobacteraceae bacterium]
MAAAEEAGFDVLITVDQEIPYQQNLGLRKISILVLFAATNRLADLTSLLPEILDALAEIAPGEVRRVGASSSR